MREVPTLDGCEALWVGREEPPDLGLLEASGVRVARAATVVEALDRFFDGSLRGVSLAIVHADALGTREAERWAALRRAGAATLVGVYPPESAWRADRASLAGADFAVTLPAAPGALADVCRRFARRATSSAPQAAATVTDSLASSDVLLPQPVAAEPTSWTAGALADATGLGRMLQDLDRLLDVTVEDFRRASGARRVSVLLFDQDRKALVVRRTTAAAPPDSPWTAPADGPALRVASSDRATDRPTFVDDVGSPPPELADAAFGPADRRYETPSCALVPLRGVEGTIGVVCLADREGGAPFDAAALPVLTALAEQAGLALANALELRRLRELASIDELTGLANRRQFRIAIDLEVQRARRYDRPMTLALLDLDHFKAFNDTCGHPAGDRALAMVGEILRTSLREVDVVARYGGEEFAVILPETSARPSNGAKNPFPFLERLRKRIEETAFPGAEKLPGGKLTVSGGVASFPDDAATVEDLIREADQALYASKAKGRNTITYRGRPL